MEHFKAIILKYGRGCLREVSFMRVLTVVISL